MTFHTFIIWWSSIHLVRIWEVFQFCLLSSNYAQGDILREKLLSLSKLLSRYADNRKPNFPHSVLTLITTQCLKMTCGSDFTVAVLIYVLWAKKIDWEPLFAFFAELFPPNCVLLLHKPQIKSFKHEIYDKKKNVF